MPTMHTIEEHEAQQVKPYIDASIQNLSTVISKNGAKNLLTFDLEIAKEINSLGTWNDDSYTHNGITFTPVLDDDGNLLYVNVNGTANANATYFRFCGHKNFRGLPAGSYILNGCLTGGAYNKYRVRAQLCDGKESTTVISPDSDYGNGLLMTFESGGYLPNNYHIYIEIWSGQSFSNAKFYPMIRLASDPDGTYEPYAKTNQQLTQETTGLIDNQSVNGAVNVLPFDIQTIKEQNPSFSWSDNTGTKDGVSITINDDETYTAVINSAPSSNVVLTVYTQRAKNHLTGKNIRLTGSPSGGSSTTWELQTYGAVGTSEVTRDYGNGVDFTWNNDASSHVGEVAIVIRAGVTPRTLTFKPMLSVPELKLKYNDHVPYAKSNRELTDYTANYKEDGIAYNYGMFTAWSRPSFNQNTDMYNLTILEIFNAMHISNHNGSSIKIATYEASNALFNDIKTWFNMSNIKAGVLEIIKFESTRGLVRFTRYDSAEIYEGWIISSTMSNRFKYTGTALS